MAKAISKAMELDYNRQQFTPDTMPSDIIGYSFYNKQKEEFQYVPGVVQCNLLLGDEINRTSPKTQSALLEAMEERSVTVDGVTHLLPNPFICIATQNPIGTSGTQALPESQMDRFMVRLSIGYPSDEDQLKILRTRKYTNPLDNIQVVSGAENIVDIQNYLSTMTMSDEVLYYLIHLCEATRQDAMVDLGVRRRGVLALTQMARAHALLEERSYVIPEDVQATFEDVCAHRLILKPQARVEGVTERDVLQKILAQVKPPSAPKRWNHG